MNEQDSWVRECASQLLRDHDPAASEPSRFLGAQFDAGLAWIDFPVDRGGLGLAPRLQRVVDQVLAAAGAPTSSSRNAIGHGMVGPTLVAHGTSAQQARYLRPLFTGDEVWCQLFSEPGAGSDVAGLATRAEWDGGAWRLRGQKVWTTMGHVARFGLALARTDPEAPKHLGLTAFIVDMHEPTVEVRPLVQLTGHAEFNEVFLTDVRISDDDRVGEVGEGWRVAITTLMNERVAVGGRAPERGAGRIAEAVKAWSRISADRPARADRLMRLWCDAEVLRLTNLRAQQQRAMGTPGPEGSIGKIASGELNKRISEFVIDCYGAEGMLKPTGYPMTQRWGQEPYSHPVDIFLRMRANSIEGGTTEIAKNIVAERVLGLPAEVRIDKDRPWSQVPRS